MVFLGFSLLFTSFYCFSNFSMFFGACELAVNGKRDLEKTLIFDDTTTFWP